MHQINKIVLGSDHTGLNYKQYIIRALNDEYPEIETVDIGCFTSESCDYTDFAHTVAQMVSKNPTETRGVLICGTGSGMCITSNKYQNVRSVVAQSVFQVSSARKKQDINILSLGAQLITKIECMNMVRTFVDTDYETIHTKNSPNIDYNSLKPSNNPTTDYGRLTSKIYKPKPGFFRKCNKVHPLPSPTFQPEPESPMLTTPIPQHTELKKKQLELQDNQKKVYEMMLNNKLERNVRDDVVSPTIEEYKKDIEVMNSDLVDIMQKIMNARALAKKIHSNINNETNQIFNVFQ